MGRSLADYHVGWICALPIEAVLAELMLDKVHDPVAVPEDDENIYVFGQININNKGGAHHVVIAQLPAAETGKASAATVAKDMLRTFPKLKVRLMVGIAGAVRDPEANIQLGDVVVGVPSDNGPGVVQYDHGKYLEGKGFVPRGIMNKAPRALRIAVSSVQKNHILNRRGYLSYLDTDDIRELAPRPMTNNQPAIQPLASRALALLRNPEDARKQQSHDHTVLPKIHYGAIASGDAVIRDAEFAHRVRKQHGILCFEMEAAGLDAFDCLIIRGISDYCDRYKDDSWHAYASAAAAAYAKEVLTVVPQTAVAELPSIGNTHWNVPRMLCPLFTGRETLLEDMTNHLVTGSESRCSVFVLHGIGGAGKSETAIKFATEKQDHFWGIFWIDADNEISIEQGFVDIAKLQSPPLTNTKPKDVLQWLASTRESWLLILDNCDEAEIDFAQYIPSRGGSVIITTRLTECQSLGAWANLDDMGNDNATQLLLKACGFTANEQQAHKPFAESVVKILGQHALALVHAGAYVKKGYCTLRDYGACFQDEKNHLMEFKPVQQASRYGSVYTTFEVSAKALSTKGGHDSHLALKLLSILAFLDREMVGEDLFIRAFHNCHRIESAWGLVWDEDQCRRPQSCTVFGLDPVSCESNKSKDKSEAVCAWNGRYRYVDQDDAYSRSTNIRSDPKLDLLEEESTLNPRDNVLHHTSVIDEAHGLKRPDCMTSADISNQKRLPENLNAIGSQGASQEAGNTNGWLGDYDDGDIDHLDTWHCQKVRSTGLVELQRCSRFRAACVRLADLSLIRIDGARISMHPLVHEWARTRMSKPARQDAMEQTLSILALSVEYSKAWTPSSPELQPHIETCFRNRGEGYNQSKIPLNTARALFRLAWQLFFVGSNTTAIAIFELLSSACDLPPHTWSFKFNIIQYSKAICLRNVLRVKEMQVCIEQVIESTTRWFEPDSSEVFMSQMLLATIHQETGNFQGAIALLESLDESRTLFKDLENMDRVNLLRELARAYQSLHDTQRVATLLEKRLELIQKWFPAGSPTRITCMEWLASTYMELGRADETATLLEEVVKLKFKSTTGDYLYRIKSLGNLANAYRQLGKPDQALALLEEVHDYRSRTLAPEDPTRLSNMHRLAGVYLELEKPDRAMTLLEEVVRLESGSDAPKTLDQLLTMDRLAYTYLELDMPSKALGLLEEVVAQESSLLSDEDACRLKSLRRLAQTYLRLEGNRNIQEASRLLQEVMEKGCHTLHADSKELSRTEAMLADAQEHTRRTVPSPESILYLEQERNSFEDIADKSLHGTFNRLFIALTKKVALLI